MTCESTTDLDPTRGVVSREATAAMNK
jgi:hypothetical protein